MKHLFFLVILSVAANGEDFGLNARTQSLIVKVEALKAMEYQEASDFLNHLDFYLEAEITHQFEPLLKSGHITEEQYWDGMVRIYGLMMFYSLQLNLDSHFECYAKRADYYLKRLSRLKASTPQDCSKRASDAFEKLSELTQARVLAVDIVAFAVILSKS